MPKWDLSFTFKAEDDFKKIDRASQEKIVEKLDWVKNLIVIHVIDWRDKIYKKR